MAFTITQSAGTTGLSAKVSRIIELWNDRAEKRRVYRQTFDELAQMTNRELSDLGLNRSMIRSIAHEAAYGIE